jgi:hypothetical protein
MSQQEESAQSYEEEQRLLVMIDSIKDIESEAG